MKNARIARVMAAKRQARPDADLVSAMRDAMRRKRDEAVRGKVEMILPSVKCCTCDPDQPDPECPVQGHRERRHGENSE